jgi:hypothetical protein
VRSTRQGCAWEINIKNVVRSIETATTPP